MLAQFVIAMIAVFILAWACGCDPERQSELP
jgi:hypothetical protein